MDDRGAKEGGGRGSQRASCKEGRKGRAPQYGLRVEGRGRGESEGQLQDRLQEKSFRPQGPLHLCSILTLDSRPTYLLHIPSTVAINVQSAHPLHLPPWHLNPDPRISPFPTLTSSIIDPQPPLPPTLTPGPWTHAPLVEAALRPSVRLPAELNGEGALVGCALGAEEEGEGTGGKVRRQD